MQEVHLADVHSHRFEEGIMVEGDDVLEDGVLGKAREEPGLVRNKALSRGFVGLDDRTGLEAGLLGTKVKAARPGKQAHRDAGCIRIVSRHMVMVSTGVDGPERRMLAE